MTGDVAPSTETSPRLVCAGCGCSVDAIRCVSCSTHERLRILVARAELSILVMLIVFAAWAVITFGGH